MVTKKTAKKATKKTTKKAAPKKKVATRRKTVKKKPSEAEVVVVVPSSSILDPNAIQSAAETLMDAVDTFRTELADLGEEGMISQTHIEVARFAAFAKGAMGDMEKVFAANALRLKSQGSFEEGPLRVDFDTMKGKRTPAWKDEALKQAQMLAEERGESFDTNQFAEGVLANTQAKPDKFKPVIREAS